MLYQLYPCTWKLGSSTGSGGRSTPKLVEKLPLREMFKNASPEEQQKLYQLLMDYQDVFSRDEFDLG